MVETAEVQPRSSRLRDIGVALVIGLVVVGVVFALNWQGEDKSGGVTGRSLGAGGAAPQVGKSAADFTVAGVDGRPLHLSDFKGRPVWLNFWATWCPPCRAEMPDIVAVYDEEQSKDLVILAVSIGEDADTVRQYVEKAGMKFTVGVDGRQSIADMYRVSGIPTHIFIDRDGIVRDVQVGGMSRSLMKQRLGKIL
ncbi:MAG: TlpA family protein disulfide reductase [Chloroflexota bacterium]|nr:MAG: TlpA family protein disulfide reductase [Chloroflexota bacterium]